MLWDSTVGKKVVMAVTGLVMLLFLVAHVLGNMKIFFGRDAINGYAAWLRTIGELCCTTAGFYGSCGQGW